MRGTAFAIALGLCAIGLLGAAAPTQAADGTSVVCRFDDPRFVEISGLTYSQRHKDVLYLHNDSSGGPLLFAVDARTCRTLATLTVSGIEARDLEAIASGRDARGRAILWLGDIGDNGDSWPEVRLHQIREPATLRDQTVKAVTYRFTYADRPHNAEALLADPASTRVWVVTKQLARGRLYALPRVLSRTDVNVARPVGREEGLVTDGSVSPDGTRYALRDYVDALTFRGLPAGEEEATVFLPLQPQGEAITWTPDGTALLVAGERDDRLLRVEVPASVSAAESVTEASTIAPTVSPTVTPSQPVDAAAASEASRGGLPVAPFAVALVGLAVLLIVIAEGRRRRRPVE